MKKADTASRAWNLTTAGWQRVLGLLVWAALTASGATGLAGIVIAPAAADLEGGEVITFQAFEPGQPSPQGTFDLVVKGPGGSVRQVPALAQRLEAVHGWQCRWTAPAVDRLTQLYVRFRSAGENPQELLTPVRVWPNLKPKPPSRSWRAEQARRRSAGHDRAPTSGGEPDQDAELTASPRRVLPSATASAPVSPFPPPAQASVPVSPALSQANPPSQHASPSSSSSLAPPSPGTDPREAFDLATAQETALAIITYEIRVSGLEWACDQGREDLIGAFEEGKVLPLPPEFLATCWPYGPSDPEGPEPPSHEVMFSDRIPDLWEDTPAKFLIQFTRYLTTLGSPEAIAPFLAEGALSDPEAVELADAMAPTLTQRYGGDPKRWQQASLEALKGIRKLVRRAVPILESHLKAAGNQHYPDNRQNDESPLQQAVILNMATSLPMIKGLERRYEKMFYLATALGTHLNESR